MADDRVLYAGAVKFVGGLATLWFLHSRLDRLGSRSLMVLGIVMWALVFGVGGHEWQTVAGAVRWICARRLLWVLPFAPSTCALPNSPWPLCRSEAKAISLRFTRWSAAWLWEYFDPGNCDRALVGVRVNSLGWNGISLASISPAVACVVLLVLVLQFQEEHAADLNEMLRDLSS